MSVQFLDVNRDIINAIFDLQDVREIDPVLDNIVDLHGAKKAKKDTKKKDTKKKKAKKKIAKKDVRKVKAVRLK